MGRKGEIVIKYTNDYEEERERSVTVTWSATTDSVSLVDDGQGVYLPRDVFEQAVEAISGKKFDISW